MKHPIIHKNESFNSNFAGLILFYNNLAIELLQRKNNPHENIHQTRLCFKRIRSFLRLGRKGMGDQQYKHYNAFYRDLARSLSQLRDGTALIETLPQFIKTRRTKASKLFLTSFKNLLMKQREQQLAQIVAGNIMADVVKELENKSEEISKWNFESNGMKYLQPGLQEFTGVVKNFSRLHSQNQMTIQPA
jgi:CHAD domain-containing protein